MPAPRQISAGKRSISFDSRLLENTTNGMLTPRPNAISQKLPFDAPAIASTLSVDMVRSATTMYQMACRKRVGAGARSDALPASHLVHRGGRPHHVDGQRAGYRGRVEGQLLADRVRSRGEHSVRRVLQQSAVETDGSLPGADLPGRGHPGPGWRRDDSHRPLRGASLAPGGCGPLGGGGGTGDCRDRHREDGLAGGGRGRERAVTRSCEKCARKRNYRRVNLLSISTRTLGSSSTDRSEE